MNGTGRSFLLGVLILAATVCLVLGLTLPIMRLTRFYVWTDVHSLLSVVRELYYSGEYLLAAIICIFSVLFPFVKLLYLLALYSVRQVSTRAPKRWLKRLGWLGKWSMLDVLVLALLIFYAKSTNLADATSMPGVYLFAAAVILTMIATAIIERDQAQEEQAENVDEAPGNGPDRRHQVLSQGERAG
ncbi:MAG: paraquat-inducible protein A [Rhodomicrobium sp.]|nr:paraquat-inducible protein A [Rhodomicrobium sp.]